MRYSGIDAAIMQQGVLGAVGEKNGFLGDGWACSDRAT